MNSKHLIVTCSIIAVGALFTGACSGGSGTAAHTTAQPTNSSVPNARPIVATQPTTTSTAPAVTPAKIDYTSLIPTASAVEAMLRPMYNELLSVRTEQSNLANYTERGLCGHEGSGDAFGGTLRQYLGTNSDVSVTYSVESFVGDGAQSIMTTAKDSIANCLMFRDDQGNIWSKLAVDGDVHLQNLGDDVAAVTTRDVNTDVVTGDAFVRRGQLVYALRVVSDSDTPFSLTPSVMWEFMAQALHTFVGAKV